MKSILLSLGVFSLAGAANAGAARERALVACQQPDATIVFGDSMKGSGAFFTTRGTKQEQAFVCGKARTDHFIAYADAIAQDLKGATVRLTGNATVDLGDGTLVRGRAILIHLGSGWIEATAE